MIAVVTKTSRLAGIEMSQCVLTTNPLHLVLREPLFGSVIKLGCAGALVRGHFLRVLERCAPAFHDNEIDERVLPSLTAEDLKDLGVTLVGHRRRLLDAIAALGAAVPAARSECREGR